jgi:hypothetical protein
MPTRDYPVFDQAETDAILDVAIRRQRTPVADVFLRRHHYPLAAVRLTALHYLRGEHDAAISHGLAGLKRATVPCPDILNNLMQSFISVGDYRRAMRCYEALPENWKDPGLGTKLRDVLRREPVVRGNP